MRQSSQLHPTDFGDILAGGFSLSRKTIVLALVVLVIALAIVAAATWITMTLGSNTSPSPSAGIVFVVAYAVVVSLVGSFAGAALTLGGWDVVRGTELRIGGVLERSVKLPTWIAYVQTVLVYLTLAVLWVGKGAIVQAADDASEVVGWLLNLALSLGWIYLAFSCTFMRCEVIIGGRGLFGGMKSGFQMVRGYWWRTFLLMLCGGLVILSGVMLTFLLQTAISSGVSGDYYDMSSRRAFDVFQRVFGSIPIILTVGILVMEVFGVLYMTNISTLAYVDLRARRGDFEQGMSDSDDDGDDMAFVE